MYSRYLLPAGPVAGGRPASNKSDERRGFVGPVRVAALSKLRPGGGYPAAPELSGPGGAVAEEVRVCCWCVCVCACVCRRLQLGSLRLTISEFSPIYRVEISILLAAGC